MTLFATILSSNIVGLMQSTKKMYFEVQNLFAGHVFLIFIRKCLGLISQKIFYAYLFASSLCKKCISKLLLKPFLSSQKLILWNQLTHFSLSLSLSLPLSLSLCISWLDLMLYDEFRIISSYLSSHGIWIVDELYLFY